MTATEAPDIRGLNPTESSVGEFGPIGTVGGPPAVISQSKCATCPDTFRMTSVAHRPSGSRSPEISAQHTLTQGFRVAAAHDDLNRGISIDVKGNLYASAGMHQLRGTSETLDTKTGVYVISPQGKLLQFIPIPEDLISNNGFGGEDMKTLYVTAGKTLFKFRTDIPGLPR